MHKDHVRQAQVALHQLGYPIKVASGVLDEPTCLAIVAFQRSESLPVSGALDGATFGRLMQRTGARTGAEGDLAPGTPGTKTVTTTVTTKPLAEQAEPMSMGAKIALALFGATAIGGALYLLLRPTPKKAKKPPMLPMTPSYPMLGPGSERPYVIDQEVIDAEIVE